jgi:hypothetical protein
MRKPDAIYTDIQPKDLNDYINQADEECHKLEAVTYADGEQRFDIKVWYKED